MFWNDMTVSAHKNLMLAYDIPSYISLHDKILNFIYLFKKDGWMQ